MLSNVLAFSSRKILTACGLEIKAKELTNVNVDQYFIRVKEQEKFDTMTRLMDVDQPELSIVFGRTKRRVELDR